MCFNSFRQARQTFDNKNCENFKKEFTLLKQLVDQLTLADLNLNPELVSPHAFRSPEKAPCTFVHIFENENVAMSIFILNDSYTMPLHDHPRMHGMLKAIAGRLRIQSYTEQEDITVPGMRRTIIACPEPVKDVHAGTDTAVLTPTTSNYHEITAVNGPAAFFDVLSPPYDSNMPIYGPRKCSFYRKTIRDNLLILEKVSTPHHYYCDSAEFSQPEFLYEIFRESG